MREQEVVKEDWDTLIVLDACRYDFFERMYKEYLDGKLEKRKSKSSNTIEWLVKNFTEKYNITYFSSNPFINSLGLSLRECYGKAKYDWKASEHFTRVVDVWRFGWDNNINTVPPENVNAAYLKQKDNNRTIVHYMQPHLPFLSLGIGSFWVDIKEKIEDSEDFKKKETQSKRFSSLQSWLNLKILNLLGKENVWRIRKFLSLDYVGEFEYVWRYLGGVEAIKRYYEDNLRRALEEVSQLTEFLEGKVIITSDHGEAFGENGVWIHSEGVYTPELVEVPWLIMKGGGKESNSERWKLKKQVENIKRKKIV